MNVTFGKQLCEAWGLNPDEIMQIEIVVGPREAYANITALVNGEVEKKLLDLRPVRAARIDGGEGGA